MKCGLLGKTLSHSYSPMIHSYLGQYDYSLFEKAPDEVFDFIKNGDFTGINVTIPYKKDVIPYCDILTARAKELGSVNTIVRRADGKLIGHNTDYFGFQSMLGRTGIQITGKKALVLGSGGASVTAVAVLRESGAAVTVISRAGDDNYNNLDRHIDAALIVNTTPVGMYPHTGVSPINLDLFPKLEYVIDIVYNPARTQLLLDAEKRGIPCCNGLWMLVAQANAASEWFTGAFISEALIADVCAKLHRKAENLILIGMPGSGKSTVGALLAEKLQKKFVDADAYIESLTGKTIPEIFREQGERVFRDWETKALAELGKQSGLVIATGGGCVTRKDNYPLLHQNGTICWIKRNIDLLPLDGRPLSQANSLEEIYRKRQPFYELFADISVDNDRSIEDCISKILEGYVKYENSCY